MEMKRMFVQVVNLTEGKVFSLPTLYTDRTEACVCGQNYIRDRQAEDPRSELFFRVLDAHPDGSVAPSYDLWDDEDDDGICPHPEQEHCRNCPHFYECQGHEEVPEPEYDEEPEHGESVYGNTEEPSTESLAELLSVFSAIRPNY